MISTIARKEMTAYLTDARFQTGSLLIIALFAISVHLGAAEFRQLRSLSGISQTSVFNDQIQNRRMQNLWVWIHEGHWQQNRPVRYLQMLVSGGETGADREFMASFKRLCWYDGDAMQNPLFLMFNRPDFLFLAGTLLTLLVFLLSYDAVSGETEGNTLHLLLASPVSRGAVICGKWLGGVCALLIPFLMSLAVVILMLLVQPDIAPDAQDMARMTLVFMAGMLYLTVMYALAVAVSVLAGSSTVSIVALLVVWGAAVLAIPALAPQIAQAAHGRVSIQEAQNRATHAAVTQYGADMEQVYKRHDIDRIFRSKTPMPAERAAFEIDQFNTFKHSQEKVLSFNRQQLDQEERINATATWINRLSPFGCFENLVLALAHTGFTNERELGRANQSFVSDQLAYITEKSSNGNSMGDMSRSQPRYRIPMPNLKADLMESAFDAVLLALYGVLFFIIGYAAFARKNVAG